MTGTYMKTMTNPAIIPAGDVPAETVAGLSGSPSPQRGGNDGSGGAGIASTHSAVDAPKTSRKTLPNRTATVGPPIANCNRVARHVPRHPTCTRPLAVP